MDEDISKISATDLERQIFEKEEIRVVIRARKNEEFEEYVYDRKAATNTSMTDLYNNRLKPILGDKYDADIIDGYGNNLHGRTKFEKVRNSYAEK